MKDTSIPPNNPSDTVCKKICRFNQNLTYCIGCKRTIVEIKEWHTYSIGKKNYIKDKIILRKL